MDARLNRISYIPGNRPPLAKITTDKTTGAAPLTVSFSAAKSIDYDKDGLVYSWSFTNRSTQSNEPVTEFVFEQPGIYDIMLKVTDENGASATAYEKIMVGNEAPQIDIQLATPDNVYWKGKTIGYTITASDSEDGTIPDTAVKVSLSYLPEGRDMILATDQ